MKREAERVHTKSETEIQGKLSAKRKFKLATEKKKKKKKNRGFEKKKTQTAPYEGRSKMNLVHVARKQ